MYIYSRKSTKNKFKINYLIIAFIGVYWIKNVLAEELLDENGDPDVRCKVTR